MINYKVEGEWYSTFHPSIMRHCGSFKHAVVIVLLIDSYYSHKAKGWLKSYDTQHNYLCMSQHNASARLGVSDKEELRKLFVEIYKTYPILFNHIDMKGDTFVLALNEDGISKFLSEARTKTNPIPKAVYQYVEPSCDDYDEDGELIR